MNRGQGWAWKKNHFTSLNSTKMSISGSWLQMSRHSKLEQQQRLLSPLWSHNWMYSTVQKARQSNFQCKVIEVFNDVQKTTSPIGWTKWLFCTGVCLCRASQSADSIVKCFHFLYMLMTDGMMTMTLEISCCCSWFFHSGNDGFVRADDDPWKFKKNHWRMYFPGDSRNLKGETAVYFSGS